MPKRKTFIIEGPQDELDEILALFEAGELNNLLDIKVLDVKMVSAEQLESEPATAALELDLYRVWLDSLWQKGLQPAVRSTQSTTGIKLIKFQDNSVELLITIGSLSPTEIQIFLQVRPLAGKGYLPVGLKASIFDEFGEIILEKSADAQSNILDITYGQRFTCELSDRFSVGLTLGNETIQEDFPG
ncbi:DUF1822 family protein [Nostoc sp. TCL26-01]|uniref:DUF1822 family protein n=1 Tax=Nostoc sp. TCL26-01 TaxID=2576904 RepID=UPI0015C0EC0E|nr:DUF1822 family protein [Nostoc sp. TCL26-01]QLE54948.1 DUF1822 family protein [Nostoc sp. TCL26-01]